MIKFALFDAADYLTNEDTIAEHLTAALEDANPDMCLVAVRDAARARHDPIGEGLRPWARESVQGAVAGCQAASRNHPENRPGPGRQAFRHAAARLTEPRVPRRYSPETRYQSQSTRQGAAKPLSRALLRPIHFRESLAPQPIQCRASRRTAGCQPY